jgi:hypothetical protein
MTMIQMLAARLAGIERLVYHTFDATGSEAWREGKARVEAMGETKVEEIVNALTGMRFMWGVSDGN